MRYVIDIDLTKSEVIDRLAARGHTVKILEEGVDCACAVFTPADFSEDDRCELADAGIDIMKVLDSAVSGVEQQEALENAMEQALDETDDGGTRWLLEENAAK